MTVNGWPLITMPDAWGFTSMEWKLKVPTTANVSPYTGQTQVFKWPGADLMSVTVTLPPMTSDTARAWSNFTWSCQGQSVAFLLGGDPLRRTPEGTVDTPVYVSGTNNAAGLNLNLRGFNPNQPNVLVNGDLIQINYRLYSVLNARVSADANGNASIVVCPSLRETLTDGMVVTTHDAQGLFRLKNPETQISVGQNRLTTMSFECVEAR